MIKVCHIISGDLWAGAEVMAYNLIKGLKGYPDVQILVVALNDRKLAALIRNLNIPIHVLDESSLRFLQLLAALREIMHRFQPDVIHSHRYKEHLLAYLASRSFRRVALIGTQHGMPEGYDARGGLGRRIKTKLNFHILSRRFDCTVAVSEDMKHQFLEVYGFSEKRVQVIHNGMEIPLKPPPGKDTHQFTIGSSGRLFPVKDYPLMVEAAHLLRAEAKDVRFRLAGDGPERGTIHELIVRHGLEDAFELEGFVDDMPGFYAGLDIYMNTSLHEGIPMSILEAMAHQVPVVAPRVGGIKEIVRDGVDGYLVGSRDPAEFAQACLRLCKDRALRHQMRLAARERIAEEFSMDRMAHCYYRLYLHYVPNSALRVSQTAM